MSISVVTAPTDLSPAKNPVYWELSSSAPTTAYLIIELTLDGTLYATFEVDKRPNGHFIVQIEDYIMSRFRDKQKSAGWFLPGFGSTVDSLNNDLLVSFSIKAWEVLIASPGAKPTASDGDSAPGTGSPDLTATTTIYAIRASRQHTELATLADYRQSALNEFLTNIPQGARIIPGQEHFAYWYNPGTFTSGKVKTFASWLTTANVYGQKVIASTTSTQGIMVLPVSTTAWIAAGLPSTLQSVNFFAFAFAGTFIEVGISSAVVTFSSGVLTITDGTTSHNFSSSPVPLVFAYSGGNVLINSSAGTFTVVPGNNLSFSWTGATPTIVVGAHSGALVAAYKCNYNAAWGVSFSDGTYTILTEIRSLQTNREDTAVLHFLWMNEFGVYETWSLTSQGAYVINDDITGKATVKRTKDLVTDYNQRGYMDISILANDTYHIFFDFMNQAMVNWLNYIRGSEEVYMLVETGDGNPNWIPIIPVADSLVKEGWKAGPLSVDFSFKFANDKIRKQ